MRRKESAEPIADVMQLMQLRLWAELDFCGLSELIKFFICLLQQMIFDDLFYVSESLWYLDCLGRFYDRGASAE